MIKNLIGNKYGRLTVIKKEYIKNKHTFYTCECDCGVIKVIRGDCLGKGGTISCGCYNKEKTTSLRHGKARTKIYHMYYGMKARCYNQKSNFFHRYGGRGIEICEEWKDDFICFYNWAINNGYKEGLSIDRIDNDGNYEPSNCRWVTQKEQTRNNSRNTLITINNETHLLIEWCERFNINCSTACHKIKQGIPVNEIFK